MRAKTQFVQNQAHLCIQPINQFKIITKNSNQQQNILSDDTQLLTNFNVTVNNPYCFILMHLRNKGNKSPLNLFIPQTCIFVDKIPFDIVYESKGYIRGYRGPEHAKVRLRDIYKVFKQAWGQKQLPKNQHAIASFAEKQMLMLSDNDLLLATFKSKIDSFFKKLRYIQNKLPANNGKPIPIKYQTQQDQHNMIKLATQSLLGNIAQQQCYQIITSQAQSQGDKQKAYLKFLNKKISLFMNYQHNIRIKRCIFVYKRSDEGRYYFVNVHDMQFTNLTQAIKQRQKRLALQQQQRNKILIITPEKQIRYRSFQNRAHVQTYQQIMNGQFNSIVNRMNFHKISDNKMQQVKNQIAFKKLHPKSKFTYTQVITSQNFNKLKDKVLQNPSRKPITNPSRYVMRFYNKLHHMRVKTQVLDQVSF